MWQAFPDMCSRKLLPVFLNTRRLGTLNLTAKTSYIKGTGGVEFTQIIPVKLVTPLLKLMFIMLSEEVCMFVSNACLLHTRHHDVMLSHFLLYSVTKLSRW